LKKSKRGRHVDRLSYGFYGFSNSLISTVDTIYTIAINRRKENIFITPTYSEIIKHYKKEKYGGMHEGI